jgi:hypothetical protein
VERRGKFLPSLLWEYYNMTMTTIMTSRERRKVVEVSAV